MFDLVQVLAANRILSAPVVATESNNVEHKETAEPHDSIKDVAGFIDIRDILSSFLQGLCCVLFLLKYITAQRTDEGSRLMTVV